MTKTNFNTTTPPSSDVEPFCLPGAPFWRTFDVAGESAVGILKKNDCIAEEHAHPEAQLSILLKGTRGSLRVHDENARSVQSELLPESFAFVMPHQPHRLNWHGYGEALHLWISEPFLQELSEQCKCPIPSMRRSNVLDRSLFLIGRLLVEECDTSGQLTHTMIDHARTLMVLRLFRIADRQLPEVVAGLLSTKRLQPALDFIHGNPEKHFTLLQLASLCHASVFHFARSFTARIGIPPFAFQRRIRLQRAKVLLSTTELSIEAIGLAVGTSNATHFARLFRKEAGASPSEYRRCTHKAIDE